MSMTRVEHLKWCKNRAIQEYDFYVKEGIASATRNGLTSMMSDMSKHSETSGPVINMLCVMKMMTPMTRQQFVDFINGFN